MTCSTSLSGKNRIVLIAGILMIATTLRVTFTGAAPLLDTIRSAYSLTTAQTGLLTTLPLLAFALISPLAAPVARRFGMERSLFAALLLICAGIAIRSLPSPYLLFGGTAIIGGGIALGNVLLPGLIKRDFPHSVARLTGAYSLTMGAAAALGSAMVVPLALNGFGWQGALLMLMCFPLLALFLWLPQWRSQQHANLSTSRALHTRGIWRSPLAWQVTLFLGINSLVYYVIIGWLPAILISHGYSEAQAGTAWFAATSHSSSRFADPTFLTSCERSAWYCSVRCLDVRSGRGWALLYASTRDHLDSAFRFWFRRNNDTGVDVHWSAGKFCASGGGTLGDGTIRRVFAGSLWAAADG